MSFLIGFILFIFIVCIVYFIVKVSDMEERLEELEEKLLSRSFSKPDAVQQAAEPVAEQPDFKALLEKQKNRAEQESLPVLPEEGEISPLISVSPKEDGFFARLTAAKIFSVVGGFALILGVIFAFKYYQQHGSALARFATALIFGAALLTAGLIKRIAEPYKITAVTLCAAGIATMYASFYAGFAFYHIIPLNISFICMTAIALLSFAVALKKDASYIGMLSVIMAFLIPVLLSTGKAMYVFLFSYIGIINMAVFGVALYKKWSKLIYTALIFTILGQFFAVANNAAVNVFYIFALYVAGGALAVLKGEESVDDKVKKAFGRFICANIILAVFYTGFSVKLSALAGLFSFVFFSQIMLGVMFNKYPKIFSSIFKTACAAVFLIIIAYLNGRAFIANYYFNAVLFIASAVISLAGNFIDAGKNKELSLFDNIISLLPIFVMFGALSQFYVVSSMGHLIPLVFLLSLPLFFGFGGLVQSGIKSIKSLSFAAIIVLGIWVLLGDAACCSSLAYSGVYFFEVLLLLYAAVYLFSAVKCRVADSSLGIMRFSYAIMPFLLVSVWIYVGVKPELHYAYGAFALIAMLVIINSAFAYSFKDGRPLVFSVLGVLVAGATFYALHLSAPHKAAEELLCGSLNIYGCQALAGLFIKWIIVIYGAILLLPFIFKKRFLESKEVWAAAAFGGVAAFMLIYVTAKANFALCCLGLIPLMFALVYMLAEAVAFKWQPQEEGIQAFRLSVLGGALLFFITAVPAVALKKEWLTIALSAESVLLLWMNGRLKQNWVKYTAAGLLAAVFARLILNPAIFMYYPSGVKILNWYLYTYLFAAGAMFAGAKLYKEEGQYPVRAALNAFGAILLFALVNIEIADFYAVSGPLHFKIFGGFAETVTYTLAWAVFGILCLTAGIAKRTKLLLLCGVGLISVATVKVFFFDLWSLGSVYRLAGLFGIAAVLIFAGMMLEKFKAVLKSFND